MNINRVCICGAGTMGREIALAAAQRSFSAILYELNPAVLSNAGEWMGKNLGRLVEKGKLNSKEKEDVLQRIQLTSDIRECLADVFIEAIVEKIEPKIALFNQLAEINRGDTVFASNTSSLSVTTIAEKVQHPERVIGLHFFNPATIMKLVEVVRTPFTNNETINIALELVNQLGKTAVICKDAPGFIVNRIARPFYIESLRIAEEEGNNFSQIDAILEATGFPMGPFKLMDLIGNDVNYAVSCSVYEQLQQPARLKPSYIQEEKVKQGKLGKKTGNGYYNY